MDSKGFVGWRNLVRHLDWEKNPEYLCFCKWKSIFSILFPLHELKSNPCRVDPPKLIAKECQFTATIFYNPTTTVGIAIGRSLYSVISLLIPYRYLNDRTKSLLSNVILELICYWEVLLYSCLEPSLGKTDLRSSKELLLPLLKWKLL